MLSKITLLKTISCFLFLDDFDYINNNIVLENCLFFQQFSFVIKCSCFLPTAMGFFEECVF